MSRMQIFRIDRESNQKQETLNQIGYDLQESMTEGFFNYIDDISSKDIFKYVIIIQLFVFIFSKIPIQLNHTIGIILGLIIAYYLNDKENSLSITEMKEIELKMEQIVPKPKYFYLDSNIIELFFNISDLKEYNNQAYTDSVLFTDKFLKLMLDIEGGSINCIENYQVCVDMSNNALNSLHSIIHSLPSIKFLEKKLKNSIRTLQIYFKKHLNDIINICNGRLDKQGYNIFNKKIYKNIPNSFEETNSNYNIF